MPDKQIRIKIGASVDRSLTQVFPSIEAAAKRARKVVEAEMAGVAAAMGRLPNATKATVASIVTFERTAKAQTKTVEQSFRDLERSVSATGARMMGRPTQAIVDYGNKAKSNFASVSRAFQAFAAESDRAAAHVERAQKRMLYSVQPGAVGRAAGAAGRASVPVLASAGRAGARLALSTARDIAQGAGVDFSVASQVQKNIGLETAATDLSNSAYQQGAAGPSGQRVDPRAIIAQARQVGTETAYDPTKIMEGLQAFTAKTGDLQTAREAMKDLAVLSKATGTNIDDMVDAAGDVSANLGDVPNKGEAVVQVMRSIAGQGKLGAVEVKDLAVQMAKLAANAGQFEGKASENMALLGAFAQEARQRGGAASAAQAATSVAGLVNTFKTPARAAAFQAATGNSVYGAGGQMRNLRTLVEEAIAAKGSDPVAFKKIFANVQGARAVEGFATIYRQAGGGEQGMAAVRAEFDRLQSAAMGAGETMDSFGRAMGTTESQVQVLNNRIGETSTELQTTLAPAAKFTAEAFLSAAKWVTGIVKDITGKSAQEQAQGDYAASASASNSAQALEATIKGRDISGELGLDAGSVVAKPGELGAGVLEKAKEDEAALQKAIDEKQAKVAAFRYGRRMGPGVERKNSKGESYTDRFSDEALSEMARGGDEGAGEMLRDQRDIEAKRGELDRLKSAESAVVDHLRSGPPLKVQVIELPKSFVRPDVDDRHRTGPPGAK